MKSKIKKEVSTIFNKIAQNCPDVESLFIHGSYVTGNMSKHLYKDIRYFDIDKYIFSKFVKKEISPDVDAFVVCKDVSIAEKEIRKIMPQVRDFFITINLITRETFNDEASYKGTKAVKRILLFKPLEVFKGTGIINSAKKIASNCSQDIIKLNENYQKDIDTRKRLFHFLGVSGIEQIKVDRSFLDGLTPLYTKFIAGEIDTGFPRKRHKLVFPHSMNLKAKVEINSMEKIELE